MTAPFLTGVTVVETIPEARRAIAAARSDGARIGLVPTMGALHAGHVSLITAARQECDFMAVSIFVNPTQFGPHEDFTRYPRPLSADLEACALAGVDLVFHPSVETLYPQGYTTFVDVTGLSEVLEGAYRPGHFRGVATIVLKLLNILTPDVAYFGQKDYQQQLILRRMARELDLACEIVTCPTVRDPDGLALSSRNVYLSPEERRVALSLSRALARGAELLHGGETDLPRVREEMRRVLTESGQVVPDYITIADRETLAELLLPQPRLVGLVAARVGTTRLIDNLLIDC